MFFLLYIPIISRPLSPEAIEQLAGDLAERMLEANPDGAGFGGETSKDKRELQKQIAEMMTNMQNNYRDRNGLADVTGQGDLDADYVDGDDHQLEAAEVDNAADIERLAPARDFLERCFKKSA